MFGLICFLCSSWASNLRQSASHDLLVRQAHEACSLRSKVLQKLVAFASQNINCPQKEDIGLENARGLNGEYEMVLALAKLQMIAPLILT